MDFVSGCRCVKDIVLKVLASGLLILNAIGGTMQGLIVSKKEKYFERRTYVGDAETAYICYAGTDQA